MSDKSDSAMKRTLSRFVANATITTEIFGKILNVIESDTVQKVKDGVGKRYLAVETEAFYNFIDYTRTQWANTAKELDIVADANIPLGVAEEM